MAWPTRWGGAIAARGQGGAGGWRAEVVSRGLDVFDEPDDRGFSTGRLREGAVLRVLRRVDADWLEVEPPRGSISWVDEDAVRDLGDGRVRVSAARAAVRPGRAGALMPGAIRVILGRGEIARRVDHPSLVLGRGPNERAFLAIEPPARETRFVRARGVRSLEGPIGRVDGMGGGEAARWVGTAGASRRGDRDETARRAAFTDDDVEGPPSGAGGRGDWIARREDDGFGSGSNSNSNSSSNSDSNSGSGPTTSASGGMALSGALAGRAAELEAFERGMLAEPPPRWRFGELIERYRNLLAEAADPGDRSEIERRIRVLEARGRAGESARRIEELLRRGRERDEAMRLARRRDGAPAAERRNPGLIGELYPSSRERDGRRLHALFDPRVGRVTAYLDIPPGLPADEYVGDVVEVEGPPTFQEDLNANVIEVREIHRLERRPG